MIHVRVGAMVLVIRRRGLLFLRLRVRLRRMRFSIGFRPCRLRSLYWPNPLRLRMLLRRLLALLCCLRLALRRGNRRPLA